MNTVCHYTRSHKLKLKQCGKMLTPFASQGFSELEFHWNPLGMDDFGLFLTIQPISKTTCQLVCFRNIRI